MSLRRPILGEGGIRGTRRGTLDVTRYLAAAAYLDEGFRDEVLSQTFDERHRFIGPSHGVDVPCVVRHCLASRRLSRLRDIILTALVLLGLWGLVRSLHTEFLYPFLAAWGLVAAFLLERRPTPRRKVALFATLVVGYGVLSYFHDLSPLTFWSTVAAWAVLVVDRYWRHYGVVVRRFVRGPFDANTRTPVPLRAWEEERIAAMAEQQGGNVVVYRGFSPFVGSGWAPPRGPAAHRQPQGWSFALNVTRGSDGLDRAPIPFDVTQIHDHVVKALADLSLGQDLLEPREDGWSFRSPPSAAGPGPQVSVADRLYVHGQHIAGDARFLPDRFSPPQIRVDDLQPFVADANLRVRLYTEIKVESWNGQVILSAFVRFWRSAEYLFVETTYRVLPPLKIDYRRIDSMNPRPTLRQLFQRILLPSALQVPLCSLQAPLGVVRGATLRIARARREHLTMQAIRENRLFNYGAERTVRESGSGRRYSTYFQWLDVERFTKVIDRHLLDTIRFFLEEKGVDVGELRLRMRSIFGTGVMVEGELNARDIQTGDGPDIDGP